MPFWRPSAGQRTTHNANRKDITRDHINGTAAARDTNNELPPFARPPPPRGRPESGLAHRRPPSTPTRGVPSGHLGGALPPFLAHWLHHDGYGDGQPLVVHLRREEEVISADDGHAESGRSAEEGAQRVAAARLGAAGMAGRGGTPACPRSSQPHTQAEPRTAGREFWRVSQGRAWRVTNRGDFADTAHRRAPRFAIVAVSRDRVRSGCYGAVLI